MIVEFAIHCVPSAATAPVAPCGSLNGVNYEPIMVALDGGSLEYSGLGQLFTWALGFALLVFVVGNVVGAFMRLTRVV